MGMATMQYMNVKTAADKWGLTERRVRILCSEGRVDGVIRNGWGWNIPYDAPKPQDGRRLRRIKNVGLRPGAANYAALDAMAEEFRSRKEDQGFVWRTIGSLLPDFLSGALLLDGMDVSPSQVSQLFDGSFPMGMDQSVALLCLNARTMLLRCIQETGLGPIPAMPHDDPYLSEMKLKGMYRTLLSGIDDLNLGTYRKASIPAGGSTDDAVFSIGQQMAILLYQYDKEWQMLHPLVRSAFLFGELTRIRPFGEHDGLFALLAMACELLSGGYPPPVIPKDGIPELNADLALTRRRGNYQDVIALFETSIRRVLSLLLRRKDNHV
jgi:hypothetical protein